MYNPSFVIGNVNVALPPLIGTECLSLLTYIVTFPVASDGTYTTIVAFSPTFTSLTSMSST